VTTLSDTGPNLDLDTALDELRRGATAWQHVTLEQRAHLLHEVAAAAVTTASTWVQAACRAKGLPDQSPLAGEEWLSGPYPVAMNAATLAHSLEALAQGHSPVESSAVSRIGERTVANVFPVSIWDRLLLSGFSAQVRFQEPTAPLDVLRRAGLGQLNPTQLPGTSVVLGAGNITSIAVLDTLYELFAHNRVVILKLNPVMHDMLEPTRSVLRPLVEAGVVYVLSGGIDVGSYLINHELIDHVHITGSSQSHDAIVFGSGPEGEERRRAGEPKLRKSITSELGGVSPTIVIPDGWSARDARYQAEHVATQRLHNSGYNCIATQVVVIPARWKRREEFLSALRKEVNDAPGRSDYYPGSADRVAQARATHESAESCDHGRVLIQGLRPGDEAAVFRTEYFSPVLAVVEIDRTGTEYLKAAAQFANDQLTGTLGANVLVHPRRRRRLGEAFDSFLGSLRYGTVAVNAWTAVGYLTATAPWGGFPGATLTSVGSGIGVVHNALLLADTEQTVVTGPFRPFPRSYVTGQLTLTPKPAWFVRNRTGARTAELLMGFIAAPGWRKLPRLFVSALRG
jgi:aldehyde dehydrogenase (NAD(P)+)